MDGQTSDAQEPQQDAPPYTEEDVRLAQADETSAYQEAVISYLQGRVTTLNLEIRVRDRRIAKLEQALAEAARQTETPSDDGGGVVRGPVALDPDS